jgi:hypothetical protein
MRERRERNKCIIVYIKKEETLAELFKGVTIITCNKIKFYNWETTAKRNEEEHVSIILQ